MPIPSNSRLRNLQDVNGASGLRPLFGNASAGYTSPDVIDLRNAPQHPLWDKLRGLVQAVKDDYQDSFPSQPSTTPFGPGATMPRYGTDAATTAPPILPKRIVR